MQYSVPEFVPVLLLQGTDLCQG